MTSTTVRRRWVVVALALLLLLLVPLLRAGAADRQRAWEDACVEGGGWVETLPPPTGNPLVVQLDRPVHQCRSVAGAVLSRRD